MALIKCRECGKEISDKAESCPNCGYKKTVVMPSVGNYNSGKTLTSNLLAKVSIAIIVIVLLIAVFYPSSNNSHTTKAKSELNYNLDRSYRIAKEYVLKDLKSPSTAKFADIMDVRYKDNKDNSYTLESWVDSQNSYGATLRTKFRCIVKPDINQCIDLTFY